MEADSLFKFSTEVVISS